MVMLRRGATKLGCLMSALFMAALIYFGYPVGDMYFRYQEYQDAMKQEVLYRASKPIPEIRARLKLIADSLGLPDDAGIVVIKRTRTQITIEAHYDETIVLPGFKRDVHFEPRAQGNY